MREVSVWQGLSKGSPDPSAPGSSCEEEQRGTSLLARNNSSWPAWKHVTNNPRRSRHMENRPSNTPRSLSFLVAPRRRTRSLPSFQGWKLPPPQTETSAERPLNAHVCYATARERRPPRAKFTEASMKGNVDNSRNKRRRDSAGTPSKGRPRRPNCLLSRSGFFWSAGSH